MINLCNLLIAEEYISWCRARGMTYREIYLQVAPGAVAAGAISRRKVTLAVARANHYDQAKLTHSYMQTRRSKSMQFDFMRGSDADTQAA